MVDTRRFTDYYKGLSSREAADFNDELRKQTKRTHSAISKWRCGLVVPDDPLVQEKIVIAIKNYFKVKTNESILFPKH